ncbi:hypothetical protein OBB02_01110 [Candidatus Puniceispirillum sp.]|nr:hypothetical protein [Candidatus Puniceispirillum sp.]
MNIYSRYLIGLLLLGIATIVAIFDFSEAKKINTFSPKNIAHFSVDRKVIGVSPKIIERAFISKVQSFDNKDVIVLIGNSIAEGAGAVDRLYFSKQLAKDHNVINAGLGGDYAGASTALATLGIAANHSTNHRSEYKIVIIYPITRFYYHNSYWMSEGIKLLAKQMGLEDAVSKNGKNMNMEEAEQQDKKNFLYLNMRCAFNNAVLTEWIDKKQVWCLKALATTISNPQFIKDNERYYSLRRTPDKIREDFKAITREVPASKDNSASLLYVISLLESYLNNNNITHQIYFLLTGYPSSAVNTLTQDEQAALVDAENALLKEIQSRKPYWTTKSIKLANEEFYYDASHLNELGQRKTAEIILRTITSKN